MTSIVPRAVAFCLVAFALAAAAGSAAAQPYPNRPVRMVIAFPPGGTSDFVGRIVATRLGEFLGQPVVVENKPGASGLIGTQAVQHAAPDGYTILLAPSDFTLVAGLQAKPPYDPVKDFAAIGLLINYPHVLVANPDVPAANAKELIALAKAKPGTINYASGGNGSSNHISGAAFAYAAGIDLTHVPYKGNGPAITDLLENRVQLLFTSIGPVEAHLKSGKLKAIAVTGPSRLAALPNVPTVSENALPGYEFMTWYGLAAPAGTPQPILDRLNADLRKTMASPDVKEKLANIGGDLTVTSPQAFAEMIRGEVGRWQKLARDANLKMD
jgi:tripartite-type tricarboxylate transporter receptor subunit TctC